jgi:hypothetical protein
MADEQREPADLSWHERETLAALRRVANARSQLAAREAEVPPVPLDPDTCRELEPTHAELAKARAKSSSRFGGASARSRAADLEAREQQLLASLDLTTFDDYVTRRDQPPLPIADPAIIDFARRELQAAEAAWLEVQTMVIPDDAPEPEAPERPDLRDHHGPRGAERGVRGVQGATGDVVPYRRPAAS